MMYASFNGIEIVQKKERYSLTASGRSWKNKPDSVEASEISPEFYKNAVEAVPFFRNMGSFQRVERGYTFAGYIPVKITSISPDKTAKIVYKFFFDLKR